jgi:C-terminal processing protease CtpA/Prc
VTLRTAVVALFIIAAGTLVADTRPGWLGFGFTLERTGTEQWLRIRTIAAGGPAEKAGLQRDDLVIEVDGKKPNYSDDLALLETLARVKPGQSLKLHVVRADKHLRVIVTAAEMSDERFQRWQLNMDVARRKRAEAK